METTTPASRISLPADDQNPGVNRELLTRAAELRREAEKFGLAEEPGYSIAPALGGNVLRRMNGMSNAARRSAFRSIPTRAN